MALKKPCTVFQVFYRLKRIADFEKKIIMTKYSETKHELL